MLNGSFAHEERRDQTRFLSVLSLCLSLVCAALLSSAAHVTLLGQLYSRQSRWDDASKRFVPGTTYRAVGPPVNFASFAIAEHAAAAFTEAVVLLAASEFQSKLRRWLDGFTAGLSAFRTVALLGSNDVFVGLGSVATAVAQQVVRADIGNWAGVCACTAVLLTFVCSPLWTTVDTPGFAYRVVIVLTFAFYNIAFQCGNFFNLRRDLLSAIPLAGRLSLTWQLWALGSQLVNAATVVEISRDVFYISSTLPLTFLIIYAFVLSEREQSKPQNVRKSLVLTSWASTSSSQQAPQQEESMSGRHAALGRKSSKKSKQSEKSSDVLFIV